MNIDTQNTEWRDPIATAIKQMEEAARVLGNCLEMRGVPLRMMFMPEMVFQSFASSSSLAKALGYKSPEQKPETPIQLLDEAVRLMNEARGPCSWPDLDKLKVKIEKLREEAGV